MIEKKNTETIEILAGPGKAPEFPWNSFFPHKTKGSVWWLIKSLSGNQIYPQGFRVIKIQQNLRNHHLAFPTYSNIGVHQLSSPEIHEQKEQMEEMNRSEVGEIMRVSCESSKLVCHYTS